MLTAELARTLFAYDPLTGVITRRITTGQRAKAGSQVNCICDGYVVVKVDGKSYRVHRIAWLMVTGSWPRADIDHRDGRRSNNRWSNLRDVPRSMNAQNQRKATASNRSSGLLGVTAYRKRWVAQISANKRLRHLGVFDTPAAAHAAYVDAKRVLHPGNTL